MSGPDEREYRVEWWSGGTMSFLVAARSPAEATAKARAAPPDDDGWEVEGLIDLIVAFPADSPPTELPVTQPDDVAVNPVDRNYVVSHEFRMTYVQNVHAADANAACGKVSREDAGWRVLSDWKDWRARLIRE
jgi:hypothetical protein